MEYNNQVEEYNEKAETYNEEIDKEYEEQKAIVDANNEFVEHVKDEIEEDTSEAHGFENYTENGNDVPTNWEDNTNEDNLKTITVEKSENPEGTTVKAINIHLYLDESSNEVPYNFYEFINDEDFELSEELKERIVLAEWETAEFDANDTVYMYGENAEFAGNKVYINGQRKWMGENPNYYFFREIEGYTQGLWYQSGDMVASNATIQESEYENFGTTHVVEFEEQEREVSYLYNGEPQTETITTRTTNLFEPLKNIFSIFTYMFYRLDEEPVEMEEPIKKEHLELVEPMKLLKEKEKPVIEDVPIPIVVEPIPEPTPIPEPILDPEPTPNPSPIPEPTPSVIPIILEETEDERVPLANYTEEGNPSGYWALINLILTILTILGIFKFNKDNEYHISMIILPIIAIVAFILTENIFLPMRLVDKYTILMVIIFISQLLVHLFEKEKEKENKENT